MITFYINFELNWLRNKKVRENLISDGTSGLKLEMTSYSENAFDVINFLFCEVLGPHFIPTKFHCCQTPNGRVKRERGLLCPPPPPPIHYRGIPDLVKNGKMHCIDRKKTGNCFTFFSNKLHKPKWPLT